MVACPLDMTGILSYKKAVSDPHFGMGWCIVILVVLSFYPFCL